MSMLLTGHSHVWGTPVVAPSQIKQSLGAVMRQEKIHV